MKVLLFTHKNDIDGMGSAIFAKLAFEEVDCVLCETFEINAKVKSALDDGSILGYDLIFVADLWPNAEILARIEEEDSLNQKFYVIDHHKTSIEANYQGDLNITLRNEDEKGKCCATSLFYEHLIANGYLKDIQKAYAELAELTRRHDTWEWKDIYNDEKARELALLLDAIGPERYIASMCQKLSTNPDENIKFNDFERFLIDNKKGMILGKVSYYASKMVYKEIMGMKAGVVAIEYEYRNELPEYLKDNNYDIDFVMMITLDRHSNSFRSIKPNIEVRKVAEMFGGKGHAKASSNPISNEKFEEILNTLLET